MASPIQHLMPTALASPYASSRNRRALSYRGPDLGFECVRQEVGCSGSARWLWAPERRSSPRQAQSGAAEVLCDGDVYRGTLVDMGQGGVCVRYAASQGLPNRGQVHVAVRNAVGTKEFAGTIRWGQCRWGHICLGIQCTCDHELAELLDSPF